MDVPSTEPTTITFEADLYEGQTLLFRWMNADMAHDYSKFANHMREWLKKISVGWQSTHRIPKWRFQQDSYLGYSRS